MTTPIPLTIPQEISVLQFELKELRNQVLMLAEIISGNAYIIEDECLEVDLDDSDTGGEC